MKKGVFLLFLLITLVISPLSLKANEVTDDYLEIAQNYINSSNYTKALEYINEVIKLEPNNKFAIELKDKISPKTTEEQAQKAVETTINQLNAAKTEPQNFVVLDVPTADTEKMEYNSD